MKIYNLVEYCVKPFLIRYTNGAAAFLFKVSLRGQKCPSKLHFGANFFEFSYDANML